MTRAASPAAKAGPAVVIALAVAGLFGFAFTEDFALGGQMHEWVEAFGRVLILVCVLGWAWCRLYSSVVTPGATPDRGPYSVVRNPTHLFTLVGALGIGAQSGSIILAAVFGLASALAAWMLVRSEEKVLLAALGEPYAQRLRSVPRFIPNPGLWRDEGDMRVKPAPVVRVFAYGLLLLLAIPLAEGLQYLREIHDLPILGVLP